MKSDTSSDVSDIRLVASEMLVASEEPMTLFFLPLPGKLGWRELSRERMVTGGEGSCET